MTPARTKEEFLERFRLQLGGLALYGLHVETTGTPLQRFAHASKVVPQVEALLDDIYRYLNPPAPVEIPKPTPLVQQPVNRMPVTNGQAAKVPAVGR